MTNILIANAYAVEARGMEFFIKEMHPFCILQTVNTQAASINRVMHAKYDMLIMDMNIADACCLSLFEQVQNIDPALKVLVYSANPAYVYAIRFVELGAYAFVEKSAELPALEKAITTVLKGKKYFDEQITELMINTFLLQKNNVGSNPFSSLSSKEMEIAVYLAKGNGITKISKMIYLHTSTIATMKKRIFKKLQVSGNLELAEKARIYHLIC